MSWDMNMNLSMERSHHEEEEWKLSIFGLIALVVHLTEDGLCILTS
jgi:hypothetical protein